MIKIIRGAEVSPGIWEYSIPSLRLCGKSRQPLLDACRDIKRMGGPTGERAGLFHEGSNIPDISCTVEEGASLTVSEPDRGSGVHFVKYRPFLLSRIAEAAE